MKFEDTNINDIVFLNPFPIFPHIPHVWWLLVPKGNCVRDQVSYNTHSHAM